MELTSIDGIVGSGNSVISAESSSIVAIIKDATRNGTSATFYVTRSQYDAIIEWYWTPERKKRYKLEKVSDQEKERIQYELGVADTGLLHSNRIPCPECGHVYGAFEFIQQGVRLHGRETVETALTMNNACVLRINPTATPICPNCSFLMRATAHYYICRGYGCCQEE